ncbi:MAG: GNAT family N-acetyltransferase [Tannerellaceae bacterium]|nr:GNAT family N-acetyltransferase [Tannerellaceae bacterium]
MEKINVYRLRDNKDPWFAKFMDIYRISFPFFEQRTLSQQEVAFADERYHLDLYIQGETCVAFIAYWEFPAYIYIEHLAVNPELRGQNMGSHILSNFAGQNAKTILLEIDPLVDDVSRKRFRFYEKLGYQMNTYRHFHPAYREGCPPHELIILSLHKTLREEEFNQFTADLNEVVMHFE